MKKITRALISVHDKTGIIELATFLFKRGVEILANGASVKLLEKNGVKVSDVSKLTGFADLLDGKVKSLHPLIFAPVLVKRANAAHVDSLKTMDLEPVDLVIVNCPPPPSFIIDLEKDAKPVEEPVDISVGRIALMRAAAVNHPEVAVLSDPAQYAEFMEEASKKELRVSDATCVELAIKAFEKTASYDIAIYKNMMRKFRGDVKYHETMFFKFSRVAELRYGENPHQKAAMYRNPEALGISLAGSEKLMGRDLSFNNVVDLDVAMRIVAEFDKMAAVMVKHGSPIGVAIGKDPMKTYVKARDTDQISAFGGVLAFNGTVEKKTADEIDKTFIEAVAAPRFTDGAMQTFAASKKNKFLRVVQVPMKKRPQAPGYLETDIDMRRISGGVLLQDTNDLLLPIGGALKLTTKRKPTRKQLADMVFAWKVCKHVRSNGVVLAKDLRTVGTGVGQMNRIDSMKMAIEKAGQRALGSVMASDAFIPYKDVIEEAARRGIVAIIHPGGSRNDDEITLAADEHNIALAVTGMRHFRL